MSEVNGYWMKRDDGLGSSVGVNPIKGVARLGN